MKKVISIIIALVIIIISSIISVYYYQIEKKRDIKIVLEIKENQLLSKSLENLDFSKKTYFKYYLKTQNNGKKIKAGYYQINNKYSIVELIKILEEGKSAIFKLTIPEGSDYKSVLKILSKNNLELEKEYEEVLKTIEFPYPTPNGNFEGYFYPETYFIPINYSKKQILNVILNEFLKKFPEKEYPEKDEFYKKLIMASILEREAMVKSEKKIMASVFYNRIKKGMTLSSDATVNYVYNYKKKRMYYKDLKIDSPYNTYIYKGLPPAPIASPDKNSIEAAYNPATTDFLFFVARGNGEHYFSKTYKEHLEFQRKNKVNQ
ncbi:MAG: endolytic transglycosylase MltG [Fusobacteriaceae bacterium]